MRSRQPHPYPARSPPTSSLLRYLVRAPLFHKRILVRPPPLPLFQTSHGHSGKQQVNFATLLQLFSRMMWCIRSCQAGEKLEVQSCEDLEASVLPSISGRQMKLIRLQEVCFIERAEQATLQSEELKSDAERTAPVARYLKAESAHGSFVKEASGGCDHHRS